MSKVHYFSIILSLFFLFTFSNDIIAKDNIAQADSVIVINPFPLPGNDIPRSPELVPISASYDSFFGAVILSFSSNLDDSISGVPANVLDYAAMTYSSITDCGTYLYTFVPAYFTSAQLTNYLSYYSGL